VAAQWQHILEESASTSYTLMTMGAVGTEYGEEYQKIAWAEGQGRIQTLIDAARVDPAFDASVHKLEMMNGTTSVQDLLLPDTFFPLGGTAAPTYTEQYYIDKVMGG
jgi:hypothetical protein